MRDPYGVLGVPKNATEAAIKSAYRKLAKKLHPDANKQDKNAATKFAELNAAYEILGDEDKRKAFDRGEIDAEGKPRFRGFEGFGAGAGPGAGGFGREGHFETFSWGPEGVQRGGRGGAGFSGIDDILKGMFGGGRRTQFSPEDFAEAPDLARDVTGAVTITLQEAAKGTSRRVLLPTGKEIEVKIRCFNATAPICGLSCRSRFTRRCSAARCGCLRSMARSSSPFRPAPQAAARFASKAKACRRRTAPAICS
jgi:DnaJ-class molecular chaperone